MKSNKNQVGLGTFPLASPFTKVSTAQGEEIINTFIENGGYFIDTAPMYGAGEVEKLLGKALKGFDRGTYYLASKCGKVITDSGEVVKKSTYKDVIDECNRSLERLQADHLDLLMVHSPDKNTPFEETMEAIYKLKKDGLVKDIGVSNVNLQELIIYNKEGEVSYVQNKYSLINRSINEMDNYMLENKMKLIPYHVLEIGLLTGKVFEGFDFDNHDMRNDLPYWQKNSVAYIADWVKIYLAPLAKKLDITIGQLVVAWTLKQDLIDWLIVGTTNPKQLLVNLNANNVELDAETMDEIESAYQKLVNEVEKNNGMSLREFRGLNEKFY